MRFLKTSYIASAFTAILSVSSPCFAAASANVQVSAYVLPFVSVNAAQHVAIYQVRSEDLRRGYIDLPNSLTVTLRTNLNRGVPLIVDNGGSGRVLVRERGSEDFSENSLTINAAGYRTGELISKNFDSRIVLPVDAQEGSYPLTISMAPAI